MKSGATGFYREDAARLMVAAARAAGSPEPSPSPERAPSYIPEPLLDEPRRPPLTPEPAVNQNLRLADAILADYEDEGFAEPEPRNIARLIARILVAPFYLALLVGSIGVLVLFAKSLLLP